MLTLIIPIIMLIKVIVGVISDLSKLEMLAIDYLCPKTI